MPSKPDHDAAGAVRHVFQDLEDGPILVVRAAAYDDLRAQLARVEAERDQARECAERCRDVCDNGGPLGGMDYGPFPWEESPTDGE